MRILVSYRAIPQSPGWATGDSVVRAFRDLGHETFAYAKFYQQDKWVENLDETPKEFDLCLFLECNDGDPQYCSLKDVRARKTACWTFDNSYYPDHLRGLVDYFNFDFKFFANPLIVKEFVDAGYDNVHYLPYAADKHLHFRKHPYPKIRDIALIGSARQDRIDLINQINIKLPVKAKLITGLFRETYIDALAGTNIIVNQNPQAGRGLLNMRFWEACGAGSFVMTEAVDADVNPIEPNFLAEGNKYKDVDHLILMCDDMLNIINIQFNLFQHPHAQEVVMKHHTYHNRCQSILDTVFANERT